MSGLKEQLKQQSEQRQTGEKVTKQVGYRDSIPEKKSWDDEYTFQDKNGWKAKVYLDDMEKQPYLVRLIGPKGEEYIIDTTSLSGNDGIEDGKNNLAATHALRNLQKTLKQGDVSIKDLAKKYDKYKVKEYPADIKEKVAKQETINNEVCQKVEKLQKTGNYGMVYFNAVGSEFDKYKQKKYSRGGTVFISQSGRDTTGRDNGSYTMGIAYEDGSKNVKRLEITDLGKNSENTYNEVLTIDTLVKKGYSPERAQALMNDIANEALNGKPLKDLFKEKLRYLDEPSQNKVQSQLQQRFEQQKKDLGVGYLRKMKQVGGR